MRYVTFYWSILRGVEDLEVHKDKDTATRFYRRNCRLYFQNNTIDTRSVQLPFRYGFAHRAFFGMSIRQYNKYYGKNRGK